jgi:hypothetical protein
MSFIQRSGALVGVLALSIMAGTFATADANHSWGKYHWARTSNPFTLQLGDNVDAAWDSHLTTTSSDWSLSGPFDFGNGSTGNASNNPVRTTVVAGSTTGATCAANLGTTQVCNAAYGDNGWLGLAQIWITRGSHIAQGTAKMNDTYFVLAKYDNPNERNHVMCQEVAHTFGLAHQSEDGSSQNSCMDYFSNTGANATSTLSTHPNQHDYDQLAKIYGHTDRFRTNAGGSTGTPAGLVTVSGHRPDGTPNGASPANGHWYIEPLGGGEFLVTHIHWSD